MTLQRTDGSNRDFRELIVMLDRELWDRYAEIQQEYERGNIVNDDVRVVMAYGNSIALGCGCLRGTGEQGVVEMKRVFVRPEYRRRNIARDIVVELETWAKEVPQRRIILETGKKQPEAIRLYESLGYAVIESYGEYSGKPESVCMAKTL